MHGAVAVAADQLRVLTNFTQTFVQRVQLLVACAAQRKWKILSALTRLLLCLAMNVRPLLSPPPTALASLTTVSHSALDWKQARDQQQLI